VLRIVEFAWHLLSTHGRALVALARRPDMRLRDLSRELDVTERTAHTIVTDLVSAGYLERIREGRRNRYIVRGDRPLDPPSPATVELSRLLGALVPSPFVRPSASGRLAVVLACSDHPYQEPLRNLLAEQGLIGRCDLVLFPGGGSALAGAEWGAILAALRVAVGTGPPPRLLLVAHQGCSVPGAFLRSLRDPAAAGRRIIGRRRRVVDRVRRSLGIEPELWFIDDRGPKPVAVPRREEAVPTAREPAVAGGH
jgi:hypothetical protein